VIILVAKKLKRALDGTPKVSPLILTNGRGLAWTSGSFRKAWARGSKQADIKGLTPT
jgi:hypothetical protein